MSKVVKGVVDLPHVDLRDTEGIHETILFLLQNDLLPEYFRKARLNLSEKGVTLFWRNWEYITITPEGEIEYDNHYGTMEGAKEILLERINEFYPPVRRLMDIFESAGISPQSASVRWDGEREEIVVEMEV